jgi:beta-lactam-binding protein with PASTA domain/predicted Ser/Thr protein kinase
MVELDAGQIVDGRYHLISRIGSGGMADVWLAQDAHLGRQVALKVLHRRFAQDAEFVARFRMEAEAAAGLQHPNIVAIYDRGQVGDTFYISMEYVQGRTLAEAIRGGLTPPQAVAVVRDVLEAARFAHQHGIIHRDFKPQNVILDGQGRAKVTDFGIAQAGASDITQAGSVMGTAHYLPPEQAQGLEVSYSSDLYSIGVILFEALTGHVPFHAESSVAVALKQVSEAPPRPSSLNPNISPALDAVVLRALAKDPAQRFTNADAFIAALDAAMRDPGAAPGETAVYAPLPPQAVADPEPQRRRWLWWLVAGAVLLGLLIGFLATRSNTVTVPNVTNPFGTYLTLAQARAELANEGFELAEVVRVERMVPRDTVLEQDPPPGKADRDCAFLSLFCKNPKVTLTVSAGPGQAEVPDVVGLEKDVALRRIESAGFEPELKDAVSDEVPKGQVIRTNPVAGATAQQGSTVTVVVSTGPRMVRVPALIGVQRDVAEARLKARDLTVKVSEREDEATAGEVLEQNPAPGERVPAGSEVTIVVSSGVQKVEMPSLVGSPRPDAVTTLRGLDLVPTVTEREVSDRGQNNVVLEQTPAPGSSIPVKSTVQLVVGKYVPPDPPEPPDTNPDANGNDSENG